MTEFVSGRGVVDIKWNGPKGVACMHIIRKIDTTIKPLINTYSNVLACCLSVCPDPVTCVYYGTCTKPENNKM